jgi:hypothetical protein
MRCTGTQSISFNEQHFINGLLEAVGELTGEFAASLQQSWGAFLVTFPEEGGDPWNLGQRWSSYGSPQGDWSLGVATFYSHVGPRAGGRLIVEGSHRLLQSFFEQLKPSERLSKRLSDRFFRSHPYFAELTGKTPPKPERVRRFMGEETEIDGVAVRVLELTGEPGDAVLYHRGLVSSISRNVSQETAFMRG